MRGLGDPRANEDRLCDRPCPTRPNSRTGEEEKGKKGFEHCNMATRIRAKSRETSRHQRYDSFLGWKVHA